MQHSGDKLNSSDELIIIQIKFVIFPGILNSEPLVRRREADTFMAKLVV